MSNKKKLIPFIALTISLGAFVPGCGNTTDPYLVAALQAYQQAYSNAQSQSNDCCCDPAQGGTVPSNSTGTVVNTPSNNVSTPVTTPTTSTPTDTSSSNPVADSPSSSTGNSTTTDKGQAIMAQLLQKLKAAKAYEVSVDKYERNLDGGEVVENGVNLWARAPGEVKIEVTYHTRENSKGAKLHFNSGDAKLKIRPGGALSLITTTLDMDDDRVTSPNDYSPDQTDLFGLVKRLDNPSYKAVLSGKTKIGGNDVYILDLTTSGTNTLDSRISHEHFGFEPGTMKIRLWEAFAQGEEEPYIRMTINKFEFRDSLPDDIFKV